MRFVYAIVLSGPRFLMVLNPERGWEMPGGMVRSEEAVEEAVVREVMEETGLRFEPLARMDIRDGVVFAGRGPDLVGPAEFEWRFFERLPEGIAFERSEYEVVIEWAREVILSPKD